MKIGLGTVQFGCDYGISNKNGQVSVEEVAKIIQYAETQGIDTIDTACLYGNSEKSIRQGGGKLLEEFKIVTKTPQIKEELSLDKNLEYFDNSFQNSLANLGLNSVYALLIHDSQNLFHSYGDELWKLLEEFKRTKKTQKIGVSVNTPRQLEKITQMHNIDIVQMPINILNQTFLPMLKSLKEKNIEIHCRSIFLQGLLLMDTNDINPFFNEIKPIISKLPKNRVRAAIEFIKSIEYIDKIIVGTTKLEELMQIVNEYNSIYSYGDFSQFSISDERFIVPHNWKLLK